MEKKSFDVELKAEHDDRLIKGYAATFGALDKHNDVVVQGAFEETLRSEFAEPSSDRRNRVKTLWQHRKSAPIGRPVVLEEDSTGLYFESKLTKGVQRADEALALIDDGVVDQMSFGYDTIESKMDDFQTEPGESVRARFLTKLKLWEISPVTWGANNQTTAEAKALEQLATHLKEGRVLSQANLERIEQAIAKQEESLEELRSLIDDAIDQSQAEGDDTADSGDDDTGEGDGKGGDFDALETKVNDIQDWIQSKKQE